jgi:phage shock protein B
MNDEIVPIMVVGMLFIGLPWLILHYVTKWKSAATLPVEDERLLEDLYDLARRLEDRMHTVERIVAADNPDWRPAIRSERDDEPRLDYRNERSN